MTTAPPPMQRSESERRPDFSMNRQFVHLDDVQRPLRIGIICSNGEIPRYASQIVADIEASNFAEIACIIDWPKSDGRQRPRQSLLYWLYRHLIDNVDETDADPLAPEPLRPRDGAAEFSCPRIDAANGNPVAMRKRLQGMALDVILNFATPEANKPLEAAAKDGIWFYRLANEDIDGRGDTLIDDVLRNPSNTAPVMLLRHQAGQPRPQLLYQARYALTLSLSASLNRFAPYHGSSWFVIKKLAGLASGRQLVTLGRTDATPPPSRGPGNLRILRFLLRRLRGALPRIPALLRHRKPVVDWKIGLRRSAHPLLDENATIALGQFRWLRSPPGRFWADPFLLRHDDRLWLFFEEYDRLHDKGHIACAEVRDDGSIGPVFTVLEKPWHLSYPQVFSVDGEVYMVPESVEHQTVDLYRARRFPHDWVHEKQLLDVAVVDATLHHHDGQWWMFASPMTVPGHAPVTCLWRADALTGEWRVVPTATVSSDVHHARNAGAVIRHHGKLYRVSQDCSARYGAALWFNRIEQWDQHHYREQPEKRIGSESLSGLSGIHSYNRLGDVEVIDGRFETLLP